MAESELSPFSKLSNYASLALRDRVIKPSNSGGYLGACRRQSHHHNLSETITSISYYAASTPYSQDRRLPEMQGLYHCSSRAWGHPARPCRPACERFRWRWRNNSNLQSPDLPNLPPRHGGTAGLQSNATNRKLLKMTTRANESHLSIKSTHYHILTNF